MGTFDKFNKSFTAEDRKTVDEAKKNGGSGNFEAPKGSYIGKIENMELGATKDGRPMFKVQIRLVEDNDDSVAAEYMSHFKNKKPCVFMNRVVFGTKNDMNMIASVEGWIDKLEPEKPVVFNGNYDDFMNDIMDAMEDVEGLEVAIDYDPDAFNSISITDIYE